MINGPLGLHSGVFKHNMETLVLSSTLVFYDKKAMVFAGVGP